MAIVKGHLAQAGDAVAHVGGGQIVAVVENVVADFGDAVGDGHRAQSVAVAEGAVTDGGDAVGNGDGGDSFAVVEGTAADGGDSLGDVHRSRFAAGAEHQRLFVFGIHDAVHRGHIGVVLRDVNGGKTLAVRKALLGDAGQGGGQGDGGDGVAEVKGTAVDVGDTLGHGVGAGLATGVVDEIGHRFVVQHAVRGTIGGVGGVHVDRRQIAVGHKGVGTDVDGTPSDIDVGEVGAIAEGAVIDLCDAVAHDDGLYAETPRKGIVVQKGDAVGDGHREEGIRIFKGLVADGGDGVALDGVGDDQRLGQSGGVAGEGDLAAFDLVFHAVIGAGGSRRHGAHRHRRQQQYHTQ